MTRRLDRLRLPLLLALSLLLAACQPQGPWQLKSIEGLMPDLSFRMTDDSGHPVTADDYRGKTLLLYFGYTSCPDVCPTTLARLASAIGQVPDGADAIRVLFVSVDPARDTGDRLHAYVHAFGPAFVGLHGSTEALDALTRRYRITYSLGQPDANGQYEVTHSSGVFVFDDQGHARLLARPSDTAATLANDLRRLLGSEPASAAY